MYGDQSPIILVVGYQELKNDINNKNNKHA